MLSWDNISELFSNGVQITKDSGRNSFLGFEFEVDIFGALLSRLISDLSA